MAEGRATKLRSCEQDQRSEFHAGHLKRGEAKTIKTREPINPPASENRDSTAASHSTRGCTNSFCSCLSLPHLTSLPSYPIDNPEEVDFCTLRSASGSALSICRTSRCSVWLHLGRYARHRTSNQDFVSLYPSVSSGGSCCTSAQRL